MGKRIDFYNISLNHADMVTDYSVCDFLESIDKNIDDQNLKVVRRIGSKLIRIFPYYYSLTRRQFVIPFGKLKEKNLPYWFNENQLEEIPEKLYDINSLGYDREYNVMALTTNREGPTASDIADYLTTFIPKHMEMEVIIDPIMYNTGIEKIRNADLVRNVTLSLDLGRTLNNFYNKEVQEYNWGGTLLNAFKGLASAAKDECESKTLALTFGLGHGKKDETLNRDSMLELLERINISEDFVKEIVVHYKNGQDEKVDKARLKQSYMGLNYVCKSENSQISPENLLSNINHAVADKVVIISRSVAEYYKHMGSYDKGSIKLVQIWRPDQN